MIVRSICAKSFALASEGACSRSAAAWCKVRLASPEGTLLLASWKNALFTKTKIPSFGRLASSWLVRALAGGSSWFLVAGIK